jgi:hypothetical protein
VRLVHFRAGSLSAYPLGSPMSLARKTAITLATALAVTTASARTARAQGADAVRDSVRDVVHRLATQGGDFATSWAEGSYSGSRMPFTVLHTLFDAHSDLVLNALIDGFGDTTLAWVTYRQQPITQGAVRYILLVNLVYHEDDHDDWPGYIFDQPTPERLIAAQRAWRDVVRRHAWSPS